MLLYAMFSFELCSEVDHMSCLNYHTHIHAEKVKIVLMYFLSRNLPSVLLMFCKVIIYPKAIVT